MVDQGLHPLVPSLQKRISTYTVDRLKHVIQGFNERCGSSLDQLGRKSELREKLKAQLDQWAEANNTAAIANAKKVLDRIFMDRDAGPSNETHVNLMSHIPPRKTSSFRSVAEEIVLDSDEDEACVPVTPSGTALRPPVLTLECRTEGRSSNTVIDPSLKSFEGEAPLAAAVGKRKASGPSYGTSTGSDSRKRTRYELPPGARRETRQGSSTGSAYPPLASTVAAYSTPKRYSRSGSGSRSDYDNRSSLSTRPPPPAPAKTYNFPRVRPPPSNSYGSPVSPSPSPINSSFPHVDSPPPLGKYRKDNRAFRPPLRPKGNTPTSVLNTASDASGAKEQATIPPLDDDISRFITNVPSEPIYVNGRFGDIFKATHQTIGEVALKRLRIAGATVDDEVIRRFEREADTWRRLDHPRVLKFLGTYTSGAHLYLASPFAVNGTLLKYVSDRPSVNRVRLLCETSDAVDYLHSENIIHGDIKSTNILINASGHILLCDFGLSKSITDQTSTALKGAGTPRWQSPELWDNAAKTFASDVYAFSMTIVEVLTGRLPFPDLKHDVAVFKAVCVRDERPVKLPTEYNGVLYENAWRVAEACWPKVPGDRISMSEAFRLLKADPSLA